MHKYLALLSERDVVVAGAAGDRRGLEVPFVDRNVAPLEAPLPV